MGLREALAAVLGVGLGLVLVAYPQVVIRAHAVGRVPDRGEYGGEDDRLARYRPLVRVAGVGLVLGGLYFAAVALGVA